MPRRKIALAVGTALAALVTLALMLVPLTAEGRDCGTAASHYWSGGGGATRIDDMQERQARTSEQCGAAVRRRLVTAAIPATGFLVLLWALGRPDRDTPAPP